MLKAIQRFLIIVLLVVGLLFLGYQAFLYNLVRERLPTGTLVADVNVGGMSREEAAAAINEHYLAPITLHHLEEQVDINPQDVGFNLDTEAMLDQAEAASGEVPFWEGFVEYLLNRSFDATKVQLIAGYDQAALRAQVENVASFLDKPATSPTQLLRVVCASGYVVASAGVTNPVQNTYNSSAVRVSVGVYDVTLSPAFTQSNYEIFLQVEDSINNDDIQIQVQTGTRTTTGFRLLISEQDNGGTAGVGVDRDFSYQALCERSI